MPDCPVARRRCNCGPNGSARDRPRRKPRGSRRAPRPPIPGSHRRPLAGLGEIRVTKPPARGAPDGGRQQGGTQPHGEMRRAAGDLQAAAHQRGVGDPAAMPAHGDRHHGIAAQQGTDPAQRSLRLVALAQQHALREMAVLDPGPQLVEQSPDTRPAGETVGRMAQMVQGKARLVQRPLGDQRREDGRRHPQDGAAPGRQGAVQMLEPVQRQIGPPAAGRVAAQVSQLVEPEHGQMPRGDPVGRLSQRHRREHGLDLARKPPPRSPLQPRTGARQRGPMPLGHTPGERGRQRQLRQHAQVDTLEPRLGAARQRPRDCGQLSADRARCHLPSLQPAASHLALMARTVSIH